MGETGPWSVVSTKAFVGTLEETAGRVKIVASDGRDQLELRCKRTKLAVARADAKRIPSAGTGDEECGDEGRFAPAGTTRVQVLLCGTAADDEAPRLALAAAPGVEWTWVNNDCLQGGGYRVIAKDGAFRPSY